MAQFSPSKLQQAKELVAARIDYILGEITRRSGEHKKAPQTKRRLTACFGAELAVLHLLHAEIIEAQCANMKDADWNLRAVLVQALGLKKSSIVHYSDGRALVDLMGAADAWMDQKRFVELIS